MAWGEPSGVDALVAKAVAGGTGGIRAAVGGTVGKAQPGGSEK